MTADHKNHFRLTNFEGPLDLLLFLIKKNEVSIYDIPIAQITSQYLDFLEKESFSDIEKSSDFCLMAATLVYIKSRMLLPVDIDLDDELEDPRKELVEHLIEYQKYKKLTELIQQPQDEWIIEREKAQRSLPFDRDEPMWQKIEIWDLASTFSELMSNLIPDQIIDLYEEVSVNEKLTLIHEKILMQEEFPFTDIITRPNSLMDIVCAFIALLELVRSRVIAVYQNQLFGDILIRACVVKEIEHAVAD